MAGASTDFPWENVYTLVDRAPALQDLYAHGLHLLAADHWRRLGRDIPLHLALDELYAERVQASTAVVLDAVAEATDGPVLVMKGPAVASRYPKASQRSFSDVDLLTVDARATHQALLDAGFEPCGAFPGSYYEGLHHLQPLELPGHPLASVEVHLRPAWVHWVSEPDVRAIAERAQPLQASTKVLEPDPVDHALLVAAHSWGNSPLGRIADLVDVAVLARETSAGAIERRSREWNIPRLWDTTRDAANHLLRGDSATLPLRTWARDLTRVRERSVATSHLRRWCSPFSALPPGAAVAEMARAFAEDATPTPEESWSNKAVRLREGLLHPLRPTSRHKALLGADGLRPRHRRKSG